MKRSKHSTKLTLAQSGTAKEYLFTEITIKSKWKAFRLCQFQYWDKFSNTKLRHYHSSSSHHSSSPLSSTTLDSNANAKLWLQYHIIFEPNSDRIVCRLCVINCCSDSICDPNDSFSVQLQIFCVYSCSHHTKVASSPAYVDEAEREWKMRQMQHTDSLHNDANVRIATCAIAHWAKEREWQSKCLMSDDGILCAVSPWQVSIGPNKGSLVAIDFTWHTQHTHTIHAFHVAHAQHAVFSIIIYTNSSSTYSNLSIDNADMEYVVFSRLAKRFTTAATLCVHIPIRKL